MKRILDYLPPLYDGILPEVFSRRIPAESLATCTDCAMCRRPGEPKAPAVRYFQPDARCCTYYPSLPNYLAGALLAEDSSALREGRERLRALLRAGEGAAPMALGATPGYERRYGRLGDRGFGRWHGLLCPYFRSGPNDCAVWRFRNSVCATYFCRHAMGIPGAGFWRAVQRYLGVIEESLAAHALRRLGWPSERTRAFSVVYRNWEQVYRGAHDIVRGLSPRAVERIGGSADRRIGGADGAGRGERKPAAHVEQAPAGPPAPEPGAARPPPGRPGVPGGARAHQPLPAPARVERSAKLRRKIRCGGSD